FCCDQNGPSTRREERSISQWIRDRRATPSPAHFHRNPSGRSQLAFFLRCSLGPYDSDMGARSRLEKQPTDFRQNICYFGDRTLAGGAGILRGLTRARSRLPMVLKPFRRLRPDAIALLPGSMESASV